MKYRYFVSFTGKRKDGNCDVGHTVITRSRPIEEIEDITGLERDLQAYSDFANPAVILSYQLMSKVADE